MADDVLYDSSWAVKSVDSQAKFDIDSDPEHPIETQHPQSSSITSTHTCNRRVTEDIDNLFDSTQAAPRFQYSYEYTRVATRSASLLEASYHQLPCDCLELLLGHVYWYSI
jgi:hypothetical protein